MPEGQPDRTHRQETIELAREWLVDLGVPETHRVYGLVTEIYEKTDHSARVETFAAGLAYLATQCDSDYDDISQRQVAEVSGISRSSIRTHYQDIARGIDVD